MTSKTELFRAAAKTAKAERTAFTAVSEDRNNAERTKCEDRETGSRKGKV